MAGTTKRLSVAIDHRLLAEARRLTRSRTKRATIAKALEELVKLEHRKALAHALGTGVFETTEAEFRSRRRRTHARPLLISGLVSSTPASGFGRIARAMTL